VTIMMVVLAALAAARRCRAILAWLSGRSLFLVFRHGVEL
jgi:hypothetical protein